VYGGCGGDGGVVGRVEEVEVGGRRGGGGGRRGGGRGGGGGSVVMYVCVCNIIRGGWVRERG
jgi:hypothetical protein